MNLSPTRLAAVPSLKRVPADDLATFANAVYGRTLARGEVLYRAGDVGTDACIVLSGRLSVTIGEGELVRVVGDLWPGDLVGEAAWFEPGATRNATVTATIDSECAVIERDAYAHLADNLAIVALERTLLGLMAKRIRAANNRLGVTVRPIPPAVAPTASTTGGTFRDALMRLLGAT
jgi:CRP-like cAMP-binding protein